MDSATGTPCKRSVSKNALHKSYLEHGIFFYQESDMIIRHAAGITFGDEAIQISGLHHQIVITREALK